MLYITIPYDKFEKQHIIFDKKRKNNIIKNSYFFMIHYITDFCNLHNVIIKKKLDNISIYKRYDKYVCRFNDKSFIESIKKMEYEILDMFLTKMTTSFDINDFITSKNKYTEYSSNNSNTYMSDDQIKPLNHIITDVDIQSIKQKNNNTNNGYFVISDNVKQKMNKHKYEYEYNIFNHLRNNIIKTKHVFIDDDITNNNTSIQLLIKISGICLNDNKIGLIYKFMLSK